MSINPNISPRIIPSIASLYTDIGRIFMEYIDNSVDSADVHWLDKSLKNYSRPINIKIVLKGTNYQDGTVEIIDNCFGITNFTKVVESIGDSDKKNNRFTNGQFGFGIYSFMAACSNLKIISKEINNKTQELELNRQQFDQARAEDVKIKEPVITNNYPYESGTMMVLSGFERESWKDVSLNYIKTEIEKHFELILQRKNLTISIIDQSGIESVCEPFDYDAYEGEVYEDYVTDFPLRDKRETSNKQRLPFQKTPAHIFLKITNGIAIGKPPVFFSKGRRICEIKDVRSFKSRHKSDIWAHPNVTGYIDLQDLLPPTIARTDFKNTRDSRAVFQTLIDLEDLIFEFVKNANHQADEKHYLQLEDALNKALSRLARIDAMNFRTTYLNGGDINLSNNSFGQELKEGEGSKDFGDTKNENPGPGVGDSEGKGFGLVDGEGGFPGGQEEGNQPKNEEQFADSEFKGQERKKSGFNIHISDAEPQVDAETNKQLRSILSGSEIIIFKKHSDFQTRLSHTNRGESKITERLLGYIAGEITIHYKDEFYNKHQNGQPEYNKNMFIGMAEFIYQLEDALSALSGKNLSKLSQNEN